MIVVRQKIEYDCEVLIVGGGPAGSGLAYHLAKAGVKTIVIEAEKFPRDKVCGDGVSPIALAELHAMGITQTETFKKANEIDEVGLFIKNDKAFIKLSKPEELPFHARIIPRIELDNLIYETAKRAGATYYEESRVTKYVQSREKVVTSFKKGRKEGKITSKMIVGADGSRSVIARQLKGAKTAAAFQLLGLRSYYENVEGPTNRVDVYFSEENFPGIYWMFPKGKTGANIGMAMIYKTYPQKLTQIKETFLNHIKNNPDIKARIGKGYPTGKIVGWPISFYDSKSPIVDNRLMLVGEAAGLINPLSGDGIQYSLLSARWASECILQCRERADFSYEELLNFKVRLEKEFSYDFALSNLMVQFSRNKALTPVWMTLLSVLISRAKVDAGFAEVLAGVFEGTYPSYKALTPKFIGKVLLQSGIDLQSYFGDTVGTPDQLLKDGTEVFKLMRQVVRDISKDPKVHSDWLRETADNTVTVSRHTISKVMKNSKSAAKTS